MSLPFKRFDLLTLMFLLLPPTFWGGNAVMGRALSTSISPVALSFWRWTFAALIMLPFAGGVFWRRRQDIRRSWPSLLLLSFLGVSIYNALQYTALTTSTPVSATLINAAGPAMVLIITALLFGQRPNGGQIFAALVSMSGVAVILSQGSLERVLAVRFVPGDLIMVVATLFWSLYTILLGRLRPNWPGLEFLTLQVTFGALMLVPFAAAEHVLFPREIVLDWKLVGGMAYIVVAASILGYLCWERAVMRAGAALTTYFANLIPVSAALFSWAFLDDPLGWYHAVAAVLIFLGIALFQRANRG